MGVESSSRIGALLHEHSDGILPFLLASETFAKGSTFLLSWSSISMSLGWGGGGRRRKRRRRRNGTCTEANCEDLRIADVLRAKRAKRNHRVAVFFRGSGAL